MAHGWKTVYRGLNPEGFSAMTIRRWINWRLMGWECRRWVLQVRDAGRRLDASLVDCFDRHRWRKNWARQKTAVLDSRSTARQSVVGGVVLWLWNVDDQRTCICTSIVVTLQQTRNNLQQTRDNMQQTWDTVTMAYVRLLRSCTALKLVNISSNFCHCLVAQPF